MRRTTILMAAATLAIGSMTLPIGRAIAADPADPSSPRSPNTTSDPQRTGTATDSGVETWVFIAKPAILLDPSADLRCLEQPIDVLVHAAKVGI